MYSCTDIPVSDVAACQAFSVLRRNGVNVQMISQGASKVFIPLHLKTKIKFLCTFQRVHNAEFALMQVNISLVVNDSEAKQCVQALHSAFFENGFMSEVEGADVPQNGAPLNSNGAIYGN